MRAATVLHSRWRRASRGARAVCLVLLVLMAVRLALPYAVKAYVNRQLNHTQDYGGHVGAVKIQLWRGQYQVRDLEIFKRSHGVPEPFFAASRMDLSIECKALFHGAVVGEVVMRQPRLNFVSGPTAEETQTGKGESWDKVMGSLFPFKFNRFEIRDGQVHFQNHHSTPPVDISLTQIFATATNLSNARDSKEELPGGLKAQAHTLGGGALDLQLQLNPLAAAPTFQLTCQLSNVDLTALNDFLRAYGKFDVERGTFALFTSVASKDGNYEGYLKVFFDNLDVFAWEKERQKNALEVFWQAIVGTVATVFKNQPKDQLAAKIPISGSYQGSRVGVWTAVATLLRNAFIQALVPKVDEQVTVKKVEEKTEAAGKRGENHDTSVKADKGARQLIKRQ